MSCRYIILAFVIACLVASPVAYNIWWLLSDAPHTDRSVILCTIGTTEFIAGVCAALTWGLPWLLEKSDLTALKTWVDKQLTAPTRAGKGKG